MPEGAVLRAVLGDLVTGEPPAVDVGVQVVLGADIRIDAVEVEAGAFRLGGGHPYFCHTATTANMVCVTEPSGVDRADDQTGGIPGGCSGPVCLPHDEDDRRNDAGPHHEAREQ